MSPDRPDPPTRTTQALVLARGLGMRMRAADGATALHPAQSAAADAGLKGMIPVGRPFLDHVLHALADAGIHRVGLVLGPEHEAVREYYRGLETRRIAIEFVMQLEPLGTADAVAAAEAWASGEPFLVLNGDNLYSIDSIAQLSSLQGPGTAGFAAESLGLPNARLGAFGILEVDTRGFLARVVEKPGELVLAAASPTTLISMNIWRFDRHIFNACRTVPISRRGERELPQAVNVAVSAGASFKVVPARGPVLDLSHRSDIPKVARVLAGARVDL
jgi:dTDP-glucose pyrophosphorylase